MKRTARNLTRGDGFRLQVYGEVLAATPVGNGKRMKIRLAPEDQGRRRNGGALTGSDKSAELEFLDTGHVLEFICNPGRVFHLIEDYDDGDGDDDDGVIGPDGGDDEVADPPSPSPALVED